MYDKILVAGDLAKPDRTEELLAQARKLCDPNGTIRLMHVLRRPATESLRASFMEGLLTLGGGDDPPIFPVLREGAVAPQIRAIAVADDADLVMLASRLPGMAEFSHDTIATKLTRHSAISVLVARNSTLERTAHHV